MSSSMRATCLASTLNTTFFLPQYVLNPGQFHVSSRIWSPMSSLRSNSSTAGQATQTPWSQHSLKVSKGLKHGPKPQPLPRKGASECHRAFIALGSNLGDRIGWIEKACNEMSGRGIKVIRTSSLWETEPMYVIDQDRFINGACQVETSLKPLALLNELQSIENDLGRKKVIDQGPRNIDLDILLYDNQVLDHERLKLPHPGMFEREFVLRPLAELIPGESLVSSSPWRVTQDYLNALPPAESPLSTITPLSESINSIYALQPNRKTQVMAILNLTPDSFSDGGKHLETSGSKSTELPDSPLAKLQTTVASFINSGATIIDIGGQSSAPGAKDISATEEISRVCPAIRSLCKYYLNSPNRPIFSIDTYRASVAEAAVKAGAEIVNDISAGQLDPEMLPTMARLGKTVCLMHSRGTPATMNKLTDYEPYGVIPTIAKELLDRISDAEKAGIRRWRIILDPGIGFAKTAAQNLEILRRLDELRDWPGLRGFPWLVGSSRKNFVGKITGVARPEERTWGTAATVAAAVEGGADIVRVHDVGEMVQVVKMSDAIWRY